MPLTILPTAGQSLNVTRDPIRNNFNIINTDFPIDHYPWNDALNPGRHNKVSLPVQAPAPVFAAGNSGIYSFLSAGNNEIFVHRQYVQNTVSNDIPMTQSTLSDHLPTVGQASWTYLPSGIILQWGSQTTNGAGIGLINYARTFNTVLNVIVSITDNGFYGNASIQAFNFLVATTDVRATINGVPGALGYSYLAIGY